MLAGTAQQISHSVIEDETLPADDVELLSEPADDDLEPPRDDPTQDPMEEWVETEADDPIMPGGGDPSHLWHTWTPCVSTFRPLVHREVLTLTCPVTLATKCWSKLKCTAADGAPCHIVVHARHERRVHGYADMMLVNIPRLRCKVHYSNAARRTPCTFLLTDAQVWRQVEDMQRKKEVVVSPRLVVISEKLIVTMDGYMCVLSAPTRW
jgi:hypothetical protein